MTQGRKILVVDDEPFNRDILSEELTDNGYRVESVNDGKSALSRVEASHPDLVLLDYMLPDLSGVEVLKVLRKNGNDVPVIMITAHGTIQRAVEAVKEGAYDFISRPFQIEHLSLLIEKALEQDRLRRQAEIHSDELSQRHYLVVGDSPKMKQAIELARRAATSSSTVLLQGESGTGKEIFARAIHKWSDRQKEPFVGINCVGLSKELLGSELFGHEQGAFTGAHQLKKGKMELAHGGTVFLDEVGDISEELQAKLLRFLQEREFERVGGTRLISVDIRVVAATSRRLDEAVKEGRFREDLYHRLNVIPIELPPLRERREDISVLARHFLRRYASEARKNVTEITTQAEQLLIAYDWPGNVRELGNVIERAVVLGFGPKLRPEDLPSEIAGGVRKDESNEGAYRDGMNIARRDLIRKALAKAHGNRTAAARALGLDPKYLIRLMKTLEIE